MRILVALLTLATVALTAWVTLITLQDRRAGERADEIAQQVTELRFSDQYLERRLSSAEVSAAESAGKIDLLEEASLRQNRALNALSGSSRREWQLRDSEHMLQLAVQRLSLHGDKPGAMRLLEAADQNLRQLASPLLLNARAALAADINELRAIRMPDSEGIYLTLAELIATLPDLRKKDLPGVSKARGPDDESAASQIESEGALDEDQGRTRRWLMNRLQSLTALVVVKRHTTSTQALLPPEQSQNLELNLRTMLEQAQAAALRGQEAVYADALARAGEWLERYYWWSDSQVQKASETLAQLREQPVRPPTFTLSRGLTALREIRWPVPNPGGAQEKTGGT